MAEGLNPWAQVSFFAHTFFTVQIIIIMVKK